MARSRTMPDGLSDTLRSDIERAGYYPAVVADCVAGALAGEPVRSSLVHLETTFDGDEVRRHVTVLALTPTRLVVAHTDDHSEPAAEAAPHSPDAAPVAGRPVALTSTECVALSRVHSVVVTRMVTDPERYVPGSLPTEVTVTIAWGAASRLDLEPATCGDRGCEADHGYTGTVTADDITLRISAAAEGPDAVCGAVSFAAAVSAATAEGA